ncbi:MAG: SpoIID/LytB domain-containing protein [Peptostreptococcaceae bacterium]|nr:SpoIID/LytB domain-containing protein [Peptostreptococcaceae bacterium]
MKTRIILLLMTAICLFRLSDVHAEAAPQSIRIGLFFGSKALSQVSVGGTDLLLLDQAGNVIGNLGESGVQTSYTVKPEAGARNEKMINIYNAAGEMMLSYREDSNAIIHPMNAPIYINKKPYRGGVSFKIDKSGKLTVINVLWLEEYLYGVVPKEMVYSWGMEALKAQAVAARTYAIRNYGRYGAQGFDLCPTQNCQVYGGIEAENPRTTQAVDETRGLVLYHAGKPIQAVYHSSSGGTTENSENIWAEPIPYLRAVNDEFSLGSPHDEWEYEITKANLEKKLAAAGKKVGSILAISTDKVSENGRVLKMTIIGTKGSASYEREGLRKFIGYSNLKSNWFMVGAAFAAPPSSDPFSDISAAVAQSLQSAGTVQPAAVFSTAGMADTDLFLFRGRGYGHGLGMSQYGARKMAEKGYNFSDILRYYFAGAEIVQLPH